MSHGFLFKILLLASILPMPAMAGISERCTQRSHKTTQLQFKGVTSIQSIIDLGGRAYYAYKVGIYLCKLNSVEKRFNSQNWRQVCPKAKALNRSACLRAWMKENKPGSGSSLLKLSDLITTASTLDRDEARRKAKKRKKKLSWPSVFGVQATQNMAYLAMIVDIEKFHYYQIKMDSAETKNLVRVEEGPLKMALKNLIATTQTLNKNYRAVFDKSPPQNEKVKAWVFESLSNIGNVLDKQQEREYKWRLQ